MGVCQPTENRIAKILILKKNYPTFHKTVGIITKAELAKIESELWDHYLKFIEYKEDIKKNNPILHKKLFDTKGKVITDIIEVNQIQGDEEEKFYFFLNKGSFREITMRKCRIVFPRFSGQLFPKYRQEASSLTSIIITNSDIIFDEQQTYYAKLEILHTLEVSYCHLEFLPESFCFVKNLKKLCLRRNQLRSLPRAFTGFRDLRELDLSENFFVSLPKEIFSNNYELVSLNMNVNQLESFEFVGMVDKYKLEFLFLAQNKLTKIPLDIRKFKKIEYVNLDENLIKERPHNLHEEIPFNMKISCFNNAGINEIIDLSRPQETKSKPDNDLDKLKKNTIMTLNIASNIDETSNDSNESESVNQPQEAEERRKYRDKQLEHFKIEHPNTELEKEIAVHMNALVKEVMMSGYNKRNIENEKKLLCEERYIFMVEKLESIISTFREKEIGLVENFTLKELFKKCYGTYLKAEELKNNGVLPCKLEEMDPLEQNYFIKRVFKVESAGDDLERKMLEYKQDNIIKQREDVSNLIFLKHLNQSIASSRIKLFLQYLGNIDRKIKEYLVSLWEKCDNNTFLLLLTEMKLLLMEMITFYKEKSKEGVIVARFEMIMSEAKTVIHDILYNDLTLKMLYRLGLTDKIQIFQGIEQEKFIFSLTSQINLKQMHFENYLVRFIALIKTKKVDLLDFD